MSNSSDLRRCLNVLSRQFLCNYPLKEISWHKCFNTWEAQEQVINATIYHPRNQLYPVKVSYQKAFVKLALQHFNSTPIEELIYSNEDEDGVNDIVFEALGEIISQPENASGTSYKHYIAGQSIVTLSENVQIISEGTTGLNTWQAGLVLAEWCLANKNLLEGETIAELGAGLGLVGLTIALNCNKSNVVLTDCHHKVLTQLVENIHLNIKLNCNGSAPVDTKLQKDSLDYLLCEQVQHKDASSSSIISVLEHAWSATEPNTVASIGAGIILAADVVYDSTLFPDLINCISLFLSAPRRKCKLILVCTQRNADTLNFFLEKLGDKCDIREGQVPEQKHFTWSTEVPIRLFVVTSK